MENKKYSILIVEDSQIICSMLERMLKLNKYYIAGKVAMGNDVLNTALETKPDLILMDIVLADDVDGIEASKKVKEVMDIPIIYLTGHVDKDLLERAFITDPSSYIPKPFQERDLIITIQLALHRYEMKKKLEERENWFINTLNYIKDGVITVDKNRKINSLNSMASILTGFKYEDAVGRRLRTVFKTTGAQHEKIEDAIKEQLLSEKKIEYSSKDDLYYSENRTVPIEFTVSPIFDTLGKTSGSVIVFRDISEENDS